MKEADRSLFVVETLLKRKRRKGAKKGALQRAIVGRKKIIRGEDQFLVKHETNRTLEPLESF